MIPNTMIYASRLSRSNIPQMLHNEDPPNFPEFPGYEIIRPLSKGFLGQTACFRNCQDKNIYVIKSFNKSFIGPPQNIRSFYQKIQQLNSNQFLFISGYVDAFEDEESIYLVRPYLDYPNLSDYITSAGLQTTGKLEVEVNPMSILESQVIDNNSILNLWKSIVKCYVYLHEKGIFPNPIKPSNIFIVEGKYIVLTDMYEITSDLTVAFNTFSANQILFLAPEFFNQRLSTCRPSSLSDVWTLGVLLLVMCGYDLPWEMKNFGSLLNHFPEDSFKYDQSIPSDILFVVKHALIVQPTKRVSVANLLRLANFHDDSLVRGTKLQKTKNLGCSKKNMSYILNAKSSKCNYFINKQSMPNNCTFRIRKFQATLLQ